MVLRLLLPMPKLLGLQPLQPQAERGQQQQRLDRQHWQIRTKVQLQLERQCRLRKQLQTLLLVSRLQKTASAGTGHQQDMA
jgi:hypothetical protein